MIKQLKQLQIDQKKLSNGLTMINVELPFVKSQYMGFWVQTGFSYERDREIEGVSHFLEHLVIEKSSEYVDPLELKKAFVRKGILTNAWTWMAETHYYFLASKRNISKGFDLYIDALLHPLFTDKMVNDEKGTILEELGARKNDPEYILYEKLKRMLFKNTTYSNRGLGTAKSIKEMTKEKLLDYYNQFYVANNIHFLSMGCMKFEEVKDVVMEDLTVWESNSLPKRDITFEKRNSKPNKSEKYEDGATSETDKYENGTISQTDKYVNTTKSETKKENHWDWDIVLQKDIQTSYYGLLLKGKSITSIEIYASYVILNAILSQGQASIYNQALILEDALVSDFSFDVYPTDQVTFIASSAAMDPKNLQKVTQIIKTKLRDVIDGDVELEVFERGKNYAVGLLLQSFEDIWSLYKIDLNNIFRINFACGLNMQPAGVINAVQNMKFKDAVANWQKLFDLDKDLVDGGVIKK
jgi:predicted Zn-dependent peptidase